MNRLAAWIVAAMLMAGVAYSQSLGEIARQNRQAKQANKKTAAHVYTNDEIPSVTVVRETPKSPATDGAEAASTPEDKKSDAQPAEGEKKDGDTQKTESEADAKIAAEAQKARINEQKKAVELLEREVTVAQREHQIQTAVFYTDAGSRLRDPKDWTEKQKKFQDEMSAKTKALEEAKQKLEELEQEARQPATKQ